MSEGKMLPTSPSKKSTKKEYLGIPEIKRSLEVIEQGSLTVAQRQKALEAVFMMLYKLLQKKFEDEGG